MALLAQLLAQLAVAACSGSMALAEPAQPQVVRGFVRAEATPDARSRAAPEAECFAPAEASPEATEMLVLQEATTVAVLEPEAAADGLSGAAACDLVQALLAVPTELAQVPELAQVRPEQVPASLQPLPPTAEDLQLL